MCFDRSEWYSGVGRGPSAELPGEPRDARPVRHAHRPTAAAACARGQQDGLQLGQAGRCLIRLLRVSFGFFVVLISFLDYTFFFTLFLEPPILYFCHTFSLLLHDSLFSRAKSISHRWPLKRISLSVGSIPFKTEQEEILEPQPSRPRADMLARALPSDEEDAHPVFAGCAEELARGDVDDGGEREAGLEEAVPEGRFLRNIARLCGRESESV